MKGGVRGALAEGIPVLAVLGFLVAWQLAAMLFKVPDWLLPAPTTIWTSFREHRHLLGKHFVRTTTAAVGGLAIGSLVGILLATLMVH